MTCTEEATMIYLVLLSLLVFLVVPSDQNSNAQDHLTLQKAILIEPNYTGLDCYFNANEDCYWTWDADNYTEEASASADGHKPGQNGFIRLDSGDVKRYYNKWPRQFFGPYLDPRNYTGKNCFFLHAFPVASSVMNASLISGISRERKSRESRFLCLMT